MPVSVQIEHLLLAQAVQVGLLAQDDELTGDSKDVTAAGSYRSQRKRPATIR